LLGFGFREKISSKTTSLSPEAGPSQTPDLRSITVDVAHESYLIISLWDILLIDAKSINPKP
jgi:hypothetical protein